MSAKLEKSNRTFFSLLGVLPELVGVNKKLSSVGVGGGASGAGFAPPILNSGRFRLGDGCALIDAETRAVRSIGGRAMCGVMRGVILSEGLAGRRLRRETGSEVDDVGNMMYGV